METQKVQVVSSYVRYKKEKAETKNNYLIPIGFTTSIIMLLAVMFWQVTLTLVGTGLITYKLHKIHAHREWMKQNGLLVNHINGRKEYV